MNSERERFLYNLRKPPPHDLCVERVVPPEHGDSTHRASHPPAVVSSVSETLPPPIFSVNSFLTELGNTCKYFESQLKKEEAQWLARTTRN
jgi:hypothetical protein